jgi:hypothetical protein
LGLVPAGRLAVAVAASQVEALADLRLELLNNGVPEDMVGILHTKTGSELALGHGKRIPESVTNPNDVPILLVTHQRVRPGTTSGSTRRNRPGCGGQSKRLVGNTVGGAHSTNPWVNQAILGWPSFPRTVSLRGTVRGRGCAVQGPPLPCID